MTLRSLTGSISRPKSPPSASSPSSPSSPSTSLVDANTAAAVQGLSQNADAAINSVNTTTAQVTGTATVGILAPATLILTSPNGTRYYVVVSNGGTLSTVLV